MDKPRRPPKELRPLIEWAKQHGLSASKAKRNGHYHLRDANGNLVYVIPSRLKPGRERWNIEAELRRAVARDRG